MKQRTWLILSVLLISALLTTMCSTGAPVPAAEEPAAAEEVAPAEEVAAEPAGEAVELRMTWYTDGNEDQVMRDLLDRFEADNPDIKVVMDVVAYTAILDNLPIQLAAGEGPDLARVTDLGGLSQYYLDLRPYVEDAEYWEANFGPFLAWLRAPGNEDAINGMMTQLTITGPYINRTLFEQAGVAVPSDESDEVTWEEWAAAANEVAEATGTPFALAMDRSGHRFAGPAISMGAKFFDEEGYPALDDEGFRSMAQLLIDWHEDGTMIPDTWIGAGGQYAPANEDFANAQVVLYMSGSWQVGQFNELIGDAFDWEVAPNPCGPGGCTGVPGGAALVGIGDTQHPEEVARVMDYLASEEVLREFSERTSFIPGHMGLAEQGVEYTADLPQTAAALAGFAGQVPKLSDVAYQFQGYTYNRSIMNAITDRLTQVLVGELTLDEAMQRMQDDVDAAISEATK